jgi:uncharacterized protein (DUF58 family)
MKSPLVVITGVILGIIILGLVTLQGELLLLAIPLMLYLAAGMAQRPETLQLRVERELSSEYAPQGTPVRVRLVIANRGPSVDEFEIRDAIPHGFGKPEGDTCALCFFPPQEQIELDYTVVARRGGYDRLSVSTVARDFTGLYEKVTVHPTEPRLVIHPRYPKLDRIRLVPPETRGFAGPISARQGGTGIDFYGVREYQAGDPHRQINWRLSAKSDRELFTNIYEQQRVADVGLILDARQKSEAVTAAGSLFEYSVRATAALAENLLDDGNRVSLLIYGAGVESVFPGYGRLHRDRILRALARATPGMNYALESLSYLPTRFFPAKSQLIFVSPLQPDDIPVIVRMRALGYAVIVISPNPVAFESAGRASAGESTNPARRFAEVERELMLRQVRRSGARVVNWQVDQSLESTVRSNLSHAPRPTHLGGLGA